MYDIGDDNKSYTIAKLADGKCWMTTNYNLSGGKTLSSTYYNVPSSGCSITSSGCVLPASSTSGFSSTTTAYVYNDSTYGGYYSWKAATAGTSPSSGTASYDICPKNWRLPTQAEFTSIISTYSTSSAGSKLTQSPVNMQYGGRRGNSTIYVQGSSGHYWSLTASSSTAAYRLYLDAASSGTSTNLSKAWGLSIRCIAK